MSQDEFLEDFKTWAVNLGCDNATVPSEDALKTIFKSPQRELFKTLMKRVLPRGEVEAIRENTLISKIEKVKDPGAIPMTCVQRFLPKEMQKFYKISFLNEKKTILLKRLDMHRKEYEHLAASIKTRNIKSTNLEHKQRLLQAKVTLLEFKSESLDKQLKEEDDNKKSILATMPVKLTTRTDIDTIAMDSVQKTLKTLDNFYYTTEIDNISAENQEKLWKEIRINFSDIPNCAIFSAIMYLKDKQIQNIKSLKGEALNKIIGFSYNPSSNKELLTSFEMKLAKAKGNFLGLVLRYIKTRNEHNQLQENFTKVYREFVDKLQYKLSWNNSKDAEKADEIIANYLVQLISINFSNSENEYIEQQIENLKTDIKNTNKQIENHEVLLGSIKQIYCDINASVNRLQLDMQLLNTIKDKIIYSINMLQQMLNEMKSKTTHFSMDLSNYLQPPTKINDTTFSAESFDMGTEFVLCSTKMDFDNTVNSLNSSALLRSFYTADTTAISNGTNKNLPTHLSEINVFIETSIEKFSCISQKCAFYLSPNPIITESEELSPTLQMSPAPLLTPYGVLQEIITRIKQVKHLANNSADPKFNLDLTHADTKLFEEKQKLQKEHISQLLEKIKETGTTTNFILNKCSKLYNFLLENPLRHYIPSSKTFNNQTYSDYESEYNLYYHLATTATDTDAK